MTTPTATGPDELFNASQAIKRMRKAKIAKLGVNLNYMEVESLLQLFEAPFNIEKDLEQFRREKPTLDASPMDGVGDYGSAGTAIDRAMHHLDEGLPNGQRLRCRHAFATLCAGMQELAVWMQAKGYFEDPKPPEAAAAAEADAAA